LAGTAGTAPGIPVKVICGLGNPGPEYAATRHNVGWWLVDHLAATWRIGLWRHGPLARIAAGVVAGHEVRLLEPTTYMNRSGAALEGLSALPEFDVERDLVVVVDDIALEPGRVRLRAQGSAGGHNGLKSIEAVLGTIRYPRLRIGVGAPPPGVGLVAWVLSPMSVQDKELILERFPLVEAGLRVWLGEGNEAAMSRLNC
jgi:PTH1 family peptidyl-tRNA hydrolase